jgi:hypothetical protein
MNDDGDDQSPGVFRVPMTEEFELRQMARALTHVRTAALDARMMLLSAGFTDSHRTCAELDRVAEVMALRLNVVRQHLRDVLDA